jgi:hypothetical protein
MEPILFRRSVGTTSGLPEFISQRRDLVMAERGDAMSNGALGMPMSFLGMFQGFPGIFMRRQMILFSLLLGNTMGVRGEVV